MHQPKINSNSENTLFRKSLIMNPESFWGHNLFLCYSSLSICSGHGFWPLKTGRSPRIDAKVWTINVKSDSALIPALCESGFPHCCIHWNPVARNFTVELWSFLGRRTFTKKCSSNSVLTCLQDWLWKGSSYPLVSPILFGYPHIFCRFLCVWGICLAAFFPICHLETHWWSFFSFISKARGSFTSKFKAQTDHPSAAQRYIWVYFLALLA